MTNSDQIHNLQPDTVMADPQPLPIESQPADPNQPVQLYCICRTTDESNMIGCDKCDEWYHFACVGIDIVSCYSCHLILIYDQTQIPDIETYEFTCPSCKEKEANKGKKSAKKTSQPVKVSVTIPQSQTSTNNKRDVKAASKGAAGSASVTQNKGGSDESSKGDNKKGTSAKTQVPTTATTSDSKSKIVLLNKAVNP